MSAEHTFRNLAALDGASTSRVLNLLALTKIHGENADFCSQSLFSSPILNSSIIVKHRLRADEMDLFVTRRATTTKVIIPFERNDLRSGGKSFMVGQRRYEELLREAGNYSGNRSVERDQRVLELIDSIPSLDPFLLREHLRCNDIQADSRYFNISETDQRRMFAFASEQIRRLTALAGAQRKSEATSRMVAALLSSEVDEKLEPLRLTLQLSDTDFREGVFSWRGFLYYKWSLMEFWPCLIQCLKQLKAINPVGNVTREQKVNMAGIRQAIISGAKVASDEIRATVGVYDQAFENLVSNNDAAGFRQFLLSAPAMFLDIGEKMGALTHITSFWRYRFPSDVSLTVDVNELTAILQDFSKSFLANTPMAA